MAAGIKMDHVQIGYCNEHRVSEDAPQNEEDKLLEKEFQKKSRIKKESTVFKFFCKKCNIPLCIYCKIEGGSHSSGEFSDHPLVEINQAYLQARKESQQPDPIVQKYKASIKNKLQDLDKKIETINKNAKEAES